MKILAIHDGHNASACLMVDHEIAFAVQEERLVRQKNYFGWPREAINTIFKEFDLKPSDIDKVVYSSHYMTPRMGLSAVLETFERQKKLSSVIKRFIVSKNFYRRFATRRRKVGRIKRLVDLGFSPEQIDFVEHHVAHAAAAYYGLCEDFSRPYLVLTADGSGDGFCATVSIGRDGKLERIAATHDGSSLGNVYAHVTHMMGFIPLEHEYKLMGMAAYVPKAKAEEVSAVFCKYLGLDPVDPLVFKKKTRVDIGHILRYLRVDLERIRFDHICGGLQKFTEDLLCDWVKACIKQTGIKDVLCSGGVFMNVKGNKKIMELPEVESIQVFPSCGDESNSIGAALFKYHESSVPTGPNKSRLRDYYLGGRITEEECTAAIEKFKPGFKFKIEKPAHINRAIAELLANKQIVARCSGRMEFGARALGNRSILADPSELGSVRVINQMIKCRDFWMPFAPLVLEEKAPLYVKNPKKIESPYMMMTFDSNGRVAELIAGAHNADLTVRAQLLKRAQNHDLAQILDDFEQITGRAALLNTSYNLHGLPIVCGAEDALYVFANSDLKYLALNDRLLSKVD